MSTTLVADPCWPQKGPKGGRPHKAKRPRASRAPRRPPKGVFKDPRYACKGKVPIFTPPAWATASPHECYSAGSHPWSLKMAPRPGSSNLLAYRAPQQNLIRLSKGNNDEYTFSFSISPNMALGSLMIFDQNSSEGLQVKNLFTTVGKQTQPVRFLKSKNANL